MNTSEDIPDYCWEVDPSARVRMNNWETRLKGQ